MSKQVNWESKLEKANREIDLYRDLVSLKEREIAQIEKIIAEDDEDTNVSSSYSQARISGNSLAEDVAENFSNDFAKRQPGRPFGSKNKKKQEEVPADGNSDNTVTMKRGRGRPLGSKNKKPKIVETVTTSNDFDVEENDDLDRLEMCLEKIGQRVNRAIKLEDFVKILHQNGFNYNSKTVRMTLLNLVKIGKFIQNDDEDRSYEYVDESSVVAF